MEQNLILEKTISIQGTLLMLDNSTPHVAVPVQMIRDGETVATVLSDESGKYQFSNLEPGQYQVRCQTRDGCIYYQRNGNETASLKIETGRMLEGIDFHFPPLKMGIWKNYNTLNGLAHNNVQAMYVDPEGVMWFGTSGGISRYDGREFASFTTRDGLPGNNIFTICGDLNGAIWLGTYGAGLCRYDGKEFVTFTDEDGLAGNIVTGSACAANGDLWFGTHSGVSRYDGKEFITFTKEKDGLTDDQMHTNAIHCDPDGTVWLGTGGGLSRYDGKEFINLTFDEGTDQKWNFIHSVYRDRSGFLWVGTRSGVLRHDGRNFVKLAYMDGLPDGFVVAIYQDFDDSLWFGLAMTRSRASRFFQGCGGFSPHDGKTFVNFTREDGLADYTVTALCRGLDGAMWFATDGGGVSCYNDREIVNFTMKDGLAGNRIRAIYRVSQGNMWIGASGGTFAGTNAGGVSLYDGKRFTIFTKEDGLAGNHITSICQDPDGALWFGAEWSGVSRYDGGKFTSFGTKDGWQYNRINAIFCGHDGAMWFGTGFAEGGGLARYHKGQLAIFTREYGLVDNWVLSINADLHDNLWIGTSSGLSRYDGTRFVNFTKKDGLADNCVTAIHCDADGLMWFGTSCGISRYDGKEFVNFSIHDGLSHDSVISIYRDFDGNLWFGTDGGGVSIYDGTTWSSLDTRDGLGGNTVFDIEQDLDGGLWFATDGGLVRYRRDTSKPGVRILSVTTDQTYTDLSTIPGILVGQRVTIEYIALDFKTIPGKQQYRCRIQAFGKSLSKKEMAWDWCKLTKGNLFDYTFDRPGEYTFEVQAIDRDLNYSEPAILNLNVQSDPVLNELNYLRREVGEKYHFDSIIGRSAAIRQVRALMERAIDSGLTVLIIGETGTGKELVAKAIHYNSQRKGKTLLDRNCGAIPKDLLASDLFGHRKGAFTGATEDKLGLFEAASGGTLLLDEIGEMPQDAQIQLLRVLEERKIQRLGEHISREVDVRVIAMTNRDLVKEVGEGYFREDLYYRLSEFPIRVPPLHERVEDIPLLAEHFLKEIDRDLKGFAQGVFEMLQSYSWPGNVRELRNVVRRGAALAEEGEHIQTYHFPTEITQGESLTQEILSKRAGLSASVDALQRRMIQDALKQCNGNHSQAAKILNIHRPSLIRLMRRFGIE